jgi:hypothetical protein
MQLTAFRIFKYRNIEDSGLVTLADRLTCIVGKNQSGKTNLLKGLYKFNPHDKSVKYDVRSDWPRGRRRTKDESQVVCEAHFDLDVEQDELAGLRDSAMRMPKVVVTKNYAGQYTVEFPDHPDVFPNRVHPDDVDQICAKLAVPVRRLAKRSSAPAASASRRPSKLPIRDGLPIWPCWQGRIVKSSNVLDRPIIRRIRTRRSSCQDISICLARSATSLPHCRRCSAKRTSASSGTCPLSFTWMNTEASKGLRISIKYCSGSRSRRRKTKPC